MTDVLEQLSAYSWSVGGVTTQFPVNHMEMSFGQDQAQHKFWGVDGAIVERTGRTPFVFNAKIPFTNHLTPGKNEDFSTLYPFAFRQFVLTAADGTTGVMNHPEFGPVKAKIHGDIKITWDPLIARDGAIVEVSWIETLDEADMASALINVSPVQATQTFAENLDSQLASKVVRAAKDGTQVPTTLNQTPDFATTMRQIAGIADQISIQEMRTVGKIDQIGYRIDAIENSVMRAATPPRTSVANIVNPAAQRTAIANTTLFWPIRQSINGMRIGLQDLKKTLLETGRSIVFYRVQTRSTLAMVTIATQAPIIDVMSLNPDLCRKPFIDVGTMVRYYGKSQR